MNKQPALLILSFLAAILAGCNTRPSKPAVAQTKTAVPFVAKPQPPPVVFTAKVREVTSQLKVVPGRWKMVICHHSADEKGNAAKYDKEHRSRPGWQNGLAYHFVIGNGTGSGDGEIEIGQRWTKQLLGGHVRDKLGLNEIAVGICLVGNFQNHKPTDKQIAALKELLIYLRDEVVGGPVVFKVHTEADPNHTECPGKFFPAEEIARLFAPLPSPKPSGK